MYMQHHLNWLYLLLSRQNLPKLLIHHVCYCWQEILLYRWEFFFGKGSCFARSWFIIWKNCKWRGCLLIFLFLNSVSMVLLIYKWNSRMLCLACVYLNVGNKIRFPGWMLVSSGERKKKSEMDWECEGRKQVLPCWALSMITVWILCWFLSLWAKRVSASFLKQQLIAAEFLIMSRFPLRRNERSC